MSPRLSCKLSLAVVCALALASPATAGVITFDGVVSSGQSFFGTTDGTAGLTVDGFEFTTTSGYVVDETFQPAGYPTHSSDYAFYNRPGGLTFARAGGGGFTLESLFATEVSSGATGGTTITMRGTKLDSTAITATFVTDSRSAGTKPSFQQFTLGAGWNNLQTVKLTTGTRYSLAVDDIAVNTVPLPPAAFYGVALLGGLAFLRRRRA